MKSRKRAIRLIAVANVRLIGLILVLIGTISHTPCAVALTTPKEISQFTDIEDTERFDVTVKAGYIYITTSRQVTIQLYSILGQLVTQQAIPVGTTRIKAPSRGVFILKAGTITRRVTVNS